MTATGENTLRSFPVGPYRLSALGLPSCMLVTIPIAKLHMRNNMEFIQLNCKNTSMHGRKSSEGCFEANLYDDLCSAMIM